MALVQEKKYTGKHLSSCSQLVSQCFTDAGKMYDLQFDKLVVDFKVKAPDLPRSLEAGNEVFSLDLLYFDTSDRNLIADPLPCAEEDEGMLVSNFILAAEDSHARPLLYAARGV